MPRFVRLLISHGYGARSLYFCLYFFFASSIYHKIPYQVSYVLMSYVLIMCSYDSLLWLVPKALIRIYSKFFNKKVFLPQMQAFINSIAINLTISSFFYLHRSAQLLQIQEVFPPQMQIHLAGQDASPTLFLE